jgi:hypothetical protein
MPSAFCISTSALIWSACLQFNSTLLGACRILLASWCGPCHPTCKGRSQKKERKRTPVGVREGDLQQPAWLDLGHGKLRFTSMREGSVLYCACNYL